MVSITTDYNYINIISIKIADFKDKQEQDFYHSEII
jgi:hypothetical protein